MNNPQFPTPEWLAQYENVKHILTPRIPYGDVFGQSEAYGQKLHYIDMGEVHFSTGKIMAFDPVAYPKQMRPYFQTVPTGKFNIVAMVVEDEQCIAAVRVKFSDHTPVAYHAALRGHEDLSDLKAGEYFGFPVDAGLATIMDEQTFKAYTAFEQKCRAQDEYFNLYDDFFDDELIKSYEAQPAFQSEYGDWANCALPDSKVSLPIFRSGWGDGFYPVYFGYDTAGNVCDVVIEFIPIDE